ncbi:MAG: YkgJ family cysteine cluster protein [Deltaproteobacteria bacterium]|nr:YkgJ family cysteine cluster protein [Deltaproteobacteria bacterium]
MRSPPPVPPLRPDVRPRKIQTAAGPRLVVDDPAQKIRVPIDELTLEVMECLAEGAMEQDDLAAELGAPRVELQRRVRILARSLLLETPRAAAMLELARAADHDPSPAIAPEAAPLRFAADLRHGCVACGACCHGTDVGPLSDDDVARVMAIDWAPHLPADVRREDWLVEVPASAIKAGAPEMPVRLMGHRHGRCVFLGADKLCVIHKAHGAATKPTICRQFPYTFTRTPAGIDVSFSMECRAWWTAKQAGRPPEEDEATIRALLAERAPVLALPVPVPVMDGLAWDVAGWEVVRAATLDAIGRAADLPALVRALVEPAKSSIEGVMQGFAPSEVFAERAAWGIPDPDPSDQSARFFAVVARLAQALAEGLAQIAAGMKARARYEEADRVQRLAWATAALLEGRRADDALRFAHEHEIWQDMCRAAFQAHEPVRRGGLVQGIATLVLRLASGHLLSGLLASTALRGRTSEQDATDAMVLVTKMWRGTAFERLLQAVRHDLADVFFWNAGVLAYGGAPAPVPTWAT